MEKYLALKASAGSGKTFALTVRYITLLLLEANPSQILTLTFTNKAAAEMSQRIYATLKTLGEDESYLNEISKISKLPKEEILSKKDFLLKRFSNSTLSIFTIDKFINKILREFSGYIGINDDFSIQEDDIESLSYHFLKSLDDNSYEELVSFFTYENKKFNSIFELFKALIEKNENFSSIPLDDGLIDIQKNAILDLAFKIKEHFRNCEKASDSALKAVDFKNFNELFAKSWIKNERLEEYLYFKKYSNTNIEDIFLELKQEFRNYYKLRATYSLSKIFNLYSKFKKIKLDFNKSKNYFSFNDISNLVYELLKSKISKDFLYFRLDSTYDHILIDEFQDTSILQYKILQPLIEEILAADSTKFKTFFYVGDTKQSIYRFRGGKRELFDYVLSSNKIIKIQELNTNYRSKNIVVDFVNKSFINLENYDYLKQNSTKSGGYVEVFEDENLLLGDRFENLTQKIEELLKNGINANDIAILCYTNSDVLELFYYLKEKFPSWKIKTDMTSKLVNQQNVKALINLVKYLYFKEDIYKENFNALCGYFINSKISFEVDFKKSDIKNILFKLANYFQIIDSNIIKLIELCSRFNNIVEFIYNIDKIDANIENSQDFGIQILTIFKAKGLEFHTTILLDRLKQKSVDRSSLLFYYDNIELKNIFYKIKDYEFFDENYKQAIKQEKKLSLDDEKNVLYVGLTRARNNLIIFKKQKNSAFDILKLSSCKIGTLVSSSNLEKRVILEKIKYTPLNLGRQEQKIELEKDIENINILSARYFGLATHYALEMIDNFTKDSIDCAINLSKTKYHSFLEDEDFKRIKKILLNLVENTLFQDLIKDAQILHEQSLFFNEELKIIDLLLIKNNKYIILDYKTTTEILTSHKYQINEYKRAICKIFNTKEVIAYLVYLKEEEAILLQA